MTASDLHNLLVRRFTREVIGPALEGGASGTDLVVLFESCQVGVMKVLARHHGMKPSTAVALMEASLQRAIERFAEREIGR